MKCEAIRLGDAVWFICKHGTRRRRQCQVKGCTRLATRQCDYRVTAARPRRVKTCDRWLCAAHAVSVGPNVDHCPHHPPAPRQLALTLEAPEHAL